MTPNGTTKITTRTVFDLQKFDDVKLAKEFPVPSKPTSLEEALKAVGNDQAKLLDVIHSGLVAAAGDAAYNTMDGFTVADEDNKPTTEIYNGKYADEEMGKKINAAVLSLAKLQGYEKSLEASKKEAIKQDVRQALRESPSLLKSVVGQ